MLAQRIEVQAKGFDWGSLLKCREQRQKMPLAIGCAFDTFSQVRGNQCFQGFIGRDCSVMRECELFMCEWMRVLYAKSISGGGPTHVGDEGVGAGRCC